MSLPMLGSARKAAGGRGKAIVIHSQKALFLQRHYLEDPPRSLLLSDAVTHSLAQLCPLQM